MVEWDLEADGTCCSCLDQERAEVLIVWALYAGHLRWTVAAARMGDGVLKAWKVGAEVE